MSFFNRLLAIVLSGALLGPLAPLEARTRKGDRYLAEGRVAETKRQWDAALEAYRKALVEDPAELLYQMAVEKSRFQAAQGHVDEGLRLRGLGQLGEALLEFQKAYTLNPGSAVSQQEIQRTQQMIERERQRVEQNGKESPLSEQALTPVEESRKQTQDKIRRMLPVPELRPLNPQPIDLKMNGQRAKTIFETIGKVAGINVLWDPEYTPPQKDSLNVDLGSSTLEQALDYVAVLTKSFWKPLSSNTILVTNDNPNKRRDYEEQVSRIFFLNNVSTPQEIMEILSAVRGIADIQRIYPFNSQNAILIRAEADKIALAEKLIQDLDKPRSEVVVDIMVMEASTVFSRQITAAIASKGLTLPVNFTPRAGLTVTTPSTTTDTTTTTTTTPSTSTSTSIPLSNLKHLASSDFSTTLPSALLQAVLSDTKTKILQAPQVRSVDNVKATLKIGDREPIATGSFQPGIGGVGLNPLVNTQFQYLDVGVNVDLTPHVHDNGDISMHIELEISNVNGTVNLGGIDQPIIGQRKITHEIRMHEGEIGLLGGLINQQESKSVTGIPGLSSIPLLRRLFSGDSVTRQRSELMIALIPHIIRRPEITPENIRGISVGTMNTVHLNYAPKAEPYKAAGTPAPAGAPAGTAPVAAPLPAAIAPAGTPPVTAPPAAAPPATAPPATAPAMAPPATAPPATAPPEAPGAPPGNARVQFLQGQMQTSVAAAFDVGVVIQNASDAASAPLQIQFDPKVLRLNDVVPGNFWSQDGRQPVFTKNIQNDTGSATVQIGLPPGDPGVNGVGTIAVLKFQAVAAGNSPVSIPGVVVRNSKGQAAGSGSPQLVVTVK
jgi:general secretion pathway protein D